MTVTACCYWWPSSSMACNDRPVTRLRSCSTIQILWQTITQTLINQFSVLNDIYLGIEQTLDANHGGVKHQQCSPTHTSRVQHTDTMTTKQNRKFENNNDTFVMSTGNTTIQREQRTRPTTRVPNNSSDRHRQQRNSTNAPSSLRDRRQKQQRRQHHLHYQQKIISKNIIIETWRKLFGGENCASVAKNRNVSMHSNGNGEGEHECACLFSCGYVLCHTQAMPVFNWCRMNSEHKNNQKKSSWRWHSFYTHRVYPCERPSVPTRHRHIVPALWQHYGANKSKLYDRKDEKEKRENRINRIYFARALLRST